MPSARLAREQSAVVRQQPSRPAGRPVGLTPDLVSRRTHEVSDGRLQRACLARTLVLRPRRLIRDEMTAMLDACPTAAAVRAVEKYRATVSSTGNPEPSRAEPEPSPIRAG